MTWILVLFVAGVVLLVSEFFIPGGIAGTIGIACVIASSGLAIYWYPEVSFWIVIAEFVGVILSIMLGFYILPRIGVGRRMILGAEQRPEDGWVAEVTDGSLMGATGVAFTPLRPAGMITIGDRRIDAVTTGSFVAKGGEVRVIEVHGSRIVVEPADIPSKLGTD